MLTVHNLNDVCLKLRHLADPEDAGFLQRFFKTGPGEYGEGDRFLGIRVPHLRHLARSCRTLPFDDLLKLLGSPWHEERLLALIILVDHYKRGSETDRELIFQLYLTNTRYINSWDLVDISAEHIVGAHIDPGQIELLSQLACSELLWDRRIAIVATFYWIKKDVFEPTLIIAASLIKDPHDLIHKAVGWMLREVGKRDRATEESFLREHYRVMPRTMLRYAIEHFPEWHRQEYLKGRVISVVTSETECHNAASALCQPGA